MLIYDFNIYKCWIRLITLIMSYLKSYWTYFSIAHTKASDKFSSKLCEYLWKESEEASVL